MRFLLGMVFTTVTLSAFFLFAWNRPPVIEFRLQRAIAACERVVERYADHRESLDDAARQLAPILRRLNGIMEQEYPQAYWDIDYPFYYATDSPSRCLPADDRSEQLFVPWYRMTAARRYRLFVH